MTAPEPAAPAAPVPRESALLLSLPEMGPHIEPWFARGAQDGVGAHVTVLVPFLPAEQIDASVIERLGDLFGAFEAFDVRFARTGRFPEVLYLKPEPEETFRAMTDAVYRIWPQCPPYQGQYSDLTPHLTVLYGAADEQEYDRARRALEKLLPLTARAVAVDLLEFDGDRWDLLRRFPLG